MALTFMPSRWLVYLIILTAGIASVTGKECATEIKKMALRSLGCCELTKLNRDDVYKECFRDMRAEAALTRAPTIRESIAIAVCTQECAYVANGYTDVDPPYNLDYENIHDHLMEIVPPPKQEALAFMMVAYSKCENFLKNFPKKLDIQYPVTDLFTRYCSPFAQQIAACIRIFAMQECPTTFFEQSDQCTTVRKYFKECVANINKL